MATVSVVLPLQGEMLTLERCLASLLAQTHTDLDLILVPVDEVGPLRGESDGRVRRLAAAGYSRLGAYLAGIAAAEGAYAAVLSAGDTAEPNLYEKLLELMALGTAQAAVCGYYSYISGQRVPHYQNERAVAVLAVEAANRIAVGGNVLESTNLANHLFQTDCLRTRGLLEQLPPDAGDGALVAALVLSANRVAICGNPFCTRHLSDVTASREVVLDQHRARICEATAIGAVIGTRFPTMDGSKCFRTFFARLDLVNGMLLDRAYQKSGELAEHLSILRGQWGAVSAGAAITPAYRTALAFLFYCRPAYLLYLKWTEFKSLFRAHASRQMVS